MSLISALFRYSWLVLQLRDTFKVLKRSKPRIKRSIRRGNDHGPAPVLGSGVGEGLRVGPRLRMSTLKRDQWRRLIKGWVIWTLFLDLEVVCDASFGLIMPFYSQAKMVVLLSLCIPREMSLPFLYDHFLAPKLDMYSPTVELTSALIGLLLKYGLQVGLCMTLVPALEGYEKVKRFIYADGKKQDDPVQSPTMDQDEPPVPPDPTQLPRETNHAESPLPPFDHTPLPAPIGPVRRLPRKSVIENMVDFSKGSPITLRQAMKQAKGLYGYPAPSKAKSKLREGIEKAQIEARTEMTLEPALERKKGPEKVETSGRPEIQLGQKEKVAIKRQRVRSEVVLARELPVERVRKMAVKSRAGPVGFPQVPIHPLVSSGSTIRRDLDGKADEMKRTEDRLRARLPQEQQLARARGGNMTTAAEERGRVRKMVGQGVIPMTTSLPLEPSIASSSSSSSSKAVSEDPPSVPSKRKKMDSPDDADGIIPNQSQPKHPRTEKTAAAAAGNRRRPPAPPPLVNTDLQTNVAKRNHDDAVNDVMGVVQAHASTNYTLPKRSQAITTAGTIFTTESSTINLESTAGELETETKEPVVVAGDRDRDRDRDRDYDGVNHLVLPGRSESGPLLGDARTRAAGTSRGRGSNIRKVAGGRIPVPVVNGLVVKRQTRARKKAEEEGGA